MYSSQSRQLQSVTQGFFPEDTTFSADDVPEKAPGVFSSDMISQLLFTNVLKPTDCSFLLHLLKTLIS